jgi:hypothetical protein
LTFRSWFHAIGPMNSVPVQICQNLNKSVLGPRSPVVGGPRSPVVGGPGKLTMQPSAQISELCEASPLLAISGAVFRVWVRTLSFVPVKAVRVDKSAAG